MIMQYDIKQNIDAGARLRLNGRDSENAVLKMP